MCYRYSLKSLGFAAEYYEECVAAALAQWQPRYNVPLTTPMPVITRRGRPALERMDFGFTRPARTPGERPLLVGNARAETLFTKPTFSDAVQSRRCLVPADGFYEWEKIGRDRQPHYFQRTGGEPFFFAGLWSPGPAGETSAFCIVTTAPNPLLQAIHDRMPVMLTGADARRWLGDRPLETAQVAALCQPFPAEKMTGHPVDPRVNHASYESPDCVLPHVAPPPEPDLFSSL